MSYSLRIDRAHPTCIVFMIDQSGSMSDPISGSENKPKMVAASDALNKCLRELTLKCPREEGQIKSYFDIGVIGYGQIVGSAFKGQFAGRDIVPIGELADNPARTEERIKKEDDGAGGVLERSIRFPTWIDPIANGQTPMCLAFQKAHSLLQNWLPTHQDCYPPIVINITDGEATDGDPSFNAESIKQLSTNDGNVFLFNIHISSLNINPIYFPDEGSELPNEYASLLFRMSSQLTPKMKETIQLETPINENARAFVFNADITGMIKALETGTGTGQANR